MEKYPAIKRRHKVAATLMNNTCGIDPTRSQKLDQEDLPILMQITQENGPYTNPVLRKQAIRSLRQFKAAEVIELLLKISSSSVEHDTIRGQALISLAHLSKIVTFNIIQNFLLYQPESIREYAVTALREIGDEKSLVILRDVAKKEKSRNIKIQIEASILDMESRLGFQVHKSKYKRLVLKAKSPSAN